MLLTFLAALAPLGQELGEAGAPRDERPSIVLVTIDTLRREHLGCYGYPRPTSPRVDALAANSVLFANVLAPMATTFPSHLSMLTGLYPHQHGSTSNRGALRRPYTSGPGHLSAAGALASIGYRTAGFVSVVVLHERTGIGAGFETYDAPGIGIGKRTARETMDKALAWLASVPADEPFFLWVHLFDVHEPNTPEPGFATLLAPDDALRSFVAGRVLDPLELTRRFGKNRGIGERFFALPPAKAERQLPGQRTRGLTPKNPSKAAYRIDMEALVRLHARYDACVRQVDHEVGRLIDALVERERWERTAFVFTGDHGQSLGDGSHLGHGLDTQVNVSIPLVIHFPAGTVSQPARCGALVSLVDLMPTLLAALPIAGLEAYRAQFSGRDVLSSGFTRAGVFTAEATEFHRSKKRPYNSAIVTERWKYARSEGSPGRLYDLAGAGEAVDVAAEQATIVSELERLLDAELASSVLAPEESEPLDPDGQALLDQLEELGYGGGDDDGDK
jgi:arylsulfatase